MHENINCYHLHFYSLLDILAGRKDRSGLVGQVMVNGEHQPRNFKCISGYVVQVSDKGRDDLASLHEDNLSPAP